MKQQRIAIAEACGWVIKTEQVEHTNGYQWTETRKFWVSPHGKRGELPDYLNDLNAMHEAENLVFRSAQQRRDYADALDDGNGGHFATAAQRARAFLRTIGKWEEDK
jgi:hypothetical protein